MEWPQIVALAVVQGLTEFLPISSSAHLILVPVLTDWPDQGLAFDIALHVGTLTAVVVYFRSEIGRLIQRGLAPVAGGELGPEGRFAWLIVLATIPVGIAGLIFKDVVETVLRTPVVIAWASIGFGLLLWIADHWGRRVRDEHSLGWRGALTVGAMQALALIPGTSRSGITMTAGRFLGLDRRASARFSFLLAVPVIVLAGGLQVFELLGATRPVAWGDLALGAGLAAISALLCIHFFLRFIERIGMLPFVLYRIAFGVFLLVAVVH